MKKTFRKLLASTVLSAVLMAQALAAPTVSWVADTTGTEPQVEEKATVAEESENIIRSFEFTDSTEGVAYNRGVTTSHDASLGALKIDYSTYNSSSLGNSYYNVHPGNTIAFDTIPAGVLTDIQIRFKFENFSADSYFSYVYPFFDGTVDPNKAIIINYPVVDGEWIEFSLKEVSSDFNRLTSGNLTNLRFDFSDYCDEDTIIYIDYIRFIGEDTGSSSTTAPLDNFGIDFDALKGNRSVVWGYETFSQVTVDDRDCLAITAESRPHRLVFNNLDVPAGELDGIYLTLKCADASVFSGMKVVFWDPSSPVQDTSTTTFAGGALYMEYSLVNGEIADNEWFTVYLDASTTLHTGNFGANSPIDRVSMKEDGFQFLRFDLGAATESATTIYVDDVVFVGQPLTQFTLKDGDTTSSVYFSKTQKISTIVSRFDNSDASKVMAGFIYNGEYLSGDETLANVPENAVLEVYYASSIISSYEFTTDTEGVTYNRGVTNSWEDGCLVIDYSTAIQLQNSHPGNTIKCDIPLGELKDIQIRLKVEGTSLSNFMNYNYFWIDDSIYTRGVYDSITAADGEWVDISFASNANFNTLVNDTTLGNKITGFRFDLSGTMPSTDVKVYIDYIRFIGVVQDISTPDPEIVANGECGNNLTWTLDTTGTLTINGSGDMAGWSNTSSIPWYSNRSSIKNVVIGDEVTNIGYKAFQECVNLIEVDIGDGVTTIGMNAFFNCTSLTSVTIPAGVTSIENSAFCNCISLTKANLPDSLTIIENDAFSNCDSLSNISIPDSVTKIGDSAFEGCESLTNITIPDSVTKIGVYAFSSCSSLANVSLPANLPYIELCVFAFCTNLNSVTISDGIQSIGDSAFWGCTNLTNIIISNTVTSIGATSFLDCPNLTIYGYTGSTAETFANENGIPFVSLDPTNISITLPGKADTNNAIYAEIDGVQNIVDETSGTLVMDIPESDCIIKLVEKNTNGLIVNTYYYHIDASAKQANKLNLDNFMGNLQTSMKLDGEVGIRFMAYITSAARDEETEFVLEEYGYIVSLETALAGSNAKLTLDFSPIIKGVGYSKADGKDIIFDYTDDTRCVFSGLTKGIPQSSYKENIVTRTYAKINVNGIVHVIYGEEITTSIYSLAEKILADGGSLSNLTSEQLAALRNILA